MSPAKEPVGLTHRENTLWDCKGCRGGIPATRWKSRNDLGARGRTDRGGDGDFRFGSSMHGEEIWREDKMSMPGFLVLLC